MKYPRTLILITSYALIFSLAPSSARAVDDHLKCYKIKDPVKLKGIVNLTTPQFGAVSGCRIGKARLFCAPATKSVVEAEDKDGPLTPLPLPAPAAPGDRICYKVKCPTPFPSDTEVTDQFGTRTLAKFKTTLLCTPAVKGATADPDLFQGFPATGQASCWDSSGTPLLCDGTGHDGDHEAGAPLLYTDNGDGTITDLNTGLMWEKKIDDGGTHDKDMGYTWDNAIAVHIDSLNTTAFATYTDWRLPNAKELQSIVDYEENSPAVDPVFHQAATCTGCTNILSAACSCTGLTPYWTSTTRFASEANAWEVQFVSGIVTSGAKSASLNVRAVRGGLVAE